MSKKNLIISFLLIQMVLNGIYVYLNAMVLQWTTGALNGEVSLAFLGGIFAIQTVLSFGVTFFRAGRHYHHSSLSAMVLEKVNELEYDFFGTFSPGKLNHVRESVGDIICATYAIVYIVTDACMAIIYIVIMHRVDTFVTYVTIGLYLINGLAIYLLNKASLYINKKTVNIRRQRNIEADECINGFSDVRTYCGEDRHNKSIRSLENKLISLYTKRQAIYGLMDIVANATSGIATLLAIYIVMKNGNLLLGMPLVIYVWRLQDFMADMIFQFGDVVQCIAVLPDFKTVMNHENKMKSGDVDLDENIDSIAIESVDFSYNKSTKILSNINMHIRKGECIGICGGSGEGKSTLLKLLTRFYDVNAGSIKINGLNIKDLTFTSLRHRIGMVNQSPYLFDNTIRYNVTYGNPSASETEVIEACKKAGIWDFIKTLEKGLDSDVGPRGIKLSGGQEQRISIARLFLADPEVILLDEATSSLDNTSERIIKDAITMFRDKTIVIVAHRLATIKDCDRIYVMNNHTIAEKGTHSQLMNLGGVYSRLYNEGKDE